MDLAPALITECRRRLIDEIGPRLTRCLELCGEGDLWWRPNQAVNPIGNLTLHLCGNIRQWLIVGLGSGVDQRDRDAEFAERGPIPSAELGARWSAVMTEAAAVIDRLDPAELLVERPVQAYRETGLSILIHVVEHASYHVGQITWITKRRTGADTGYYAGQDLTRRGGG